MSGAIKQLREALGNFRRFPRSEERQRKQVVAAMEKVAKEMPAAFDPTNEKMTAEEQEAYDLYQECERALSMPAPATPTPLKRRRSRSASDPSM